MKRFIKTTIPANEYKQVKRIGEKWLVHLEPSEVDQETGTVTCYEVMVDSEPDLVELGGELQEWKAYLAGRELEIAKQQKLAALAAYDKSGAVNSFEVVKDGQTIIAWIEPDKRSNYRGSLEDCVLLGVTEVEVPIAGILIPLTVADARVKLAQVQLYADRCAIVTEGHKAAIESLAIKDEVEAYNFKTGYPPKLVFSVE